MSDKPVTTECQHEWRQKNAAMCEFKNKDGRTYFAEYVCQKCGEKKEVKR